MTLCRPGTAALALAAVVATGCASTGARPQPFPTPGGRPAPSAPGGRLPAGTADAHAITGTALALRGTPYRNGGTTPAGFDCSGFVQYVFGQHGLAMPREAREQFRVGANVNRNRLQPGDLVFFTTVAPGASHVGIVTGEDTFVHAPSSRGVVRVESISSDYWRRRFVGARRPL